MTAAPSNRTDSFVRALKVCKKEFLNHEAASKQENQLRSRILIVVTEEPALDFNAVDFSCRIVVI